MSSVQRQPTAPELIAQLDIDPADMDQQIIVIPELAASIRELANRITGKSRENLSITLRRFADSLERRAPSCDARPCQFLDELLASVEGERGMQSLHRELVAQLIYGLFPRTSAIDDICILGPDVPPRREPVVQII